MNFITLFPLNQRPWALLPHILLVSHYSYQNNLFALELILVNLNKFPLWQDIEDISSGLSYSYSSLSQL